jgi:hypothetical protein
VVGHADEGWSPALKAGEELMDVFQTQATVRWKYLQ